MLKRLLNLLAGRRVVSSSVSYFIVNLAAALGPLVLIPLLVRVLTPEEYGVYGIFLTALVVVGVLFSANLELLVRRHGAEETPVLRRYMALVWRVMVLTLPVALGLALWGGPMRDVAAGWSGIPADILPWLVLGAAGIVLQNVMIYVSTMRAPPRVYGAFRLGQIGAIVAFTLAVMAAGGGLLAVVVARTAALVGSGVGALWWMGRKGLLGWRRGEVRWRPSMAYALPLVPAVFYDAGMSLISRWLLVDMGGMDSAGHYALAYQLAQPLQLVSNSLGLALFPSMMAWLDARRQRRVAIGTVGAGLVMVAIWLVYSFVVLPPVLGVVGTPAYAATLPMVAPLGLGFVLGGIALVLNNYSYHSGQTWWVSACCIFGLAVNLLAGLWMQTEIGVVWAAVLGYGASVVWLLLGRWERRRPAPLAV